MNKPENMRLFTSIATIMVLVGHVTFGQTVKTKKDKLLFDGTPVAVVKSKGRDYVYTSLNSNNQVKVTLVPSESSETGEEYLIVSEESSGKTKQVPMEWYSVSLNYKKAIGELMAKKYGLITDNGVENLDAFFNEEQETVEEEYNLEKAVASYEKRLKNNSNIEKKEGYYIDKNGKKWEGLVTITFAELIDPRENLEQARLSEGMRAVNGKLDFVDEEGEEAYSYFRAKNQDRVCVLQPGEADLCYIGIKLKTDKVLSSNSSLGDALNSSAFFEIIYEGFNAVLFKNPANPEELGLKIKENKDGFLFLPDETKRNAQNVNRYTKCEIPQSYLDIDYSDVEALKKLVVYYEQNCN